MAAFDVRSRLYELLLLLPPSSMCNDLRGALAEMRSREGCGGVSIVRRQNQAQSSRLSIRVLAPDLREYVGSGQNPDEILSPKEAAEIHERLLKPAPKTGQVQPTSLFGALLTRLPQHGKPFAALVVKDPNISHLPYYFEGREEDTFRPLRAFLEIVTLEIETRFVRLHTLANDICAGSSVALMEMNLADLRETLDWSSVAYGLHEFSEVSLILEHIGRKDPVGLRDQVALFKAHLEDEWSLLVDETAPLASHPEELKKLGKRLMELSSWLAPPTTLDRESARSEFRAGMPALRSAAVTRIQPEDDLSHKSLGVFFLTQALALSDVRERFWCSGAPSDEEMGEALFSISRLAHYLLADFPLDQRTIEALIWLLSEYAHGQLGIPEQIDLRAHLLLAAREEPALHVLKNYYRNHFFHAIEVCFLGHFLLDLEIEPGLALWDLVSKRMPEAPNRSQILKQWYLASLLHDVGYAVDVAKGLCTLTRTFGEDDPLATLADGVEQAMKKVSEQLSDEKFLGYGLEDKVGEDHGVVCARHIRRMLEEIHKQDPSVQVDSFQPAINAIGFHNSRKHPVSFEKDPLAFLLILCDTLQDWNRPYLPYSTAPIQIMTWLMGQPDAESRPEEKVHGVRLDAALVKDVFRVNANNRIHFELHYGDGVRNNNGVFYLWLDASSNLQRLDLRNCPFDIDLTFVTPHHVDRSTDKKSSNMDRLRDAARETHMSFLYRWFPDRDSTNGTTTNTAVEHRSHDEKDFLTLHLRELGREKRIFKDISHISKSLGRWRKAAEDQVFPWEYGAPDKF